MPISCECPGCGKKLKAADSAAGKKAKCPDCGGAVPIPVPREESPVAEVDDDLDLGSLDTEDGVDEEIEDDLIDCPMCGEQIKKTAIRCRHCGESLSRSKKKGKRGSSGSGMPVPIILAIIVEVAFILINLLGIGGNLMQSNIGGAIGSFVRLMINIAFTVGFFQRKSAARIAAFVMDGIGIFFMAACGVGLMAIGNLPQLPPEMRQGGMIGILLGVLVLQAVMHIVQISCLAFRSAGEFLDQ